MDAAQIRRLGRMLHLFLDPFADCFSRRPTRARLTTCLRGLLSDPPRKSAEPIALDQGVPVRTLQEFLGSHRGDHDLLRDRLQQLVARDHAHDHSVGLLDDTGCPKKGDKTPGVKRQDCGATGEVDNCVVTVHLGYAAGDFHCLLGGELYLPREWDADRARGRAAGIPDGLTYRPKGEIALELYDRAVAHGVRFAWLTFDEGYGGKPGFLRGVRARGQRYVAEVPRTFTGWLELPALTAAGRRAGAPARAVEELPASDPRLAGQAWTAYRVKDGHKGPMVWEVKRAVLFPKREDGDPGGPLHLVAARSALDRTEVKYFVSNAPPDTPVEALLLVGFSRWRVERCFEDGKTELGFDHFEGRSYPGLMRHQRLVALAHLFCARERGGGNSPGLTVCQVRAALSALVLSWLLSRAARSALPEKAAARIRRAQRRNAAARRCHARKTRRRLRAAGIKLTSVRRCRWNSSWRCSSNCPGQGGASGPLVLRRPWAACRL